MPDAIGDFHPEKIPVAEFPHPPGSVVRAPGSSLRSVVIDRDGFAFLACCTAHERYGTASGYNPCRDNGRILGGYERCGGALGDCGRDRPAVSLTDDDVGTTLPCGCEAGRANWPCAYHGEQLGVAQPDCGDCEFGVPAVWHKCGEDE